MRSNSAKPVQRLAPPLDAQDVLIRLESEGVSNAAARRRGYADLWDMAQAKYREDTFEASEAPQEKKKTSGFREYLKGIAFALPMAVSGLAMLFLQYSLWGGNLPTDVGAAVAVGTVASFIVSGGFVQAMARRGMFFLGTKEPLVCFESTLDWLGMGALALAFTACVALALNWYFAWLDPEVALMASAFLLGLGVFWLATGILYMVDRNVEVLLSVVLGLAVVTALHRMLGIQVVLAQIVGVVAAAGTAILSGVRQLMKPVTPGNSPMRPEPFARTVVHSAPYFLYGAMFYAFLFADRIIAWTANAGVQRLMFRSDYETAVNVALFAFVMQVGWVRVAGAAYRDSIQTFLGGFSARQVTLFNLAMRKFYWQRLGQFAILAAVSTAIAYAGSLWFQVTKSPTILFVAILALGACPLLVWSLWNVNLLFALSRPWKVLGALGIACAVNLVFGFVLSRVAGYQFAAAGFTLGAGVLAVLSTRNVLRTLDQADYYHFVSGA